MKSPCINCLCHFCTKTKCRYLNDLNTNICSVRCIHVDDHVVYNRNPVLICDNFVHMTLHKCYRIRSIKSHRQNYISSITLKDFLKILRGGDKHDN